MQRFVNGFSNYTPQPPKPYISPLEKALKKFPPAPKQQKAGGAQISLNGSVIALSGIPVVLPTKNVWSGNRSTNLKAKLSFPFVTPPESKLVKDESIVYGVKLQVTLSSASEIKAGKAPYTVGVIKPPSSTSPHPPHSIKSSASSPHTSQPLPLPNNQYLQRASAQFSPPSAYALDRGIVKYLHQNIPPTKPYIPLSQKYAKKAPTSSSSAKGKEAHILFNGSVIFLPPVPVALPTKSGWNEGRSQNLKGKPSFDFIPQPGAPKESSIVIGDHVVVNLNSLANIKKGNPVFTLGEH